MTSREPLFVYHKGEKIDLTTFNHPGGNFLRQFANKDITGWVLNAHYSDSTGRVDRIIRSRTVKEILDQEVIDARYPPLAREHAQKWKSVSRISLDLLPRYFTKRLLEFSIYYMAAQSVYSELAFIFTSIAVFRSVYLVHDFGHHSVFQSSFWDQLFCRIVSLTAIGVDLYPTSRTHFVHHA